LNEYIVSRLYHTCILAIGSYDAITNVVDVWLAKYTK